MDALLKLVKRNQRELEKAYKLDPDCEINDLVHEIVDQSIPVHYLYEYLSQELFEYAEELQEKQGEEE